MKPFPLSVLMRNEKYKQYDEMVWRVMFKTENKKQQVTKGSQI